ncbi:hypothetical protein [Roseibium sp.]|uniref:hypothetical protein n=1 Tax=Roseibium sp. TaxID=1936156 RepID=UPI003B52AB08
MKVLLQDNVVERVVEKVPSVVAGYQVMDWDGDRPDKGQIWNPGAQTFEDAPAAAGPPTHRTTVTAHEFKRLFTLTERMAIDQARDQSVIDALSDDLAKTAARELKRALDIFFGDLDNPLLPPLDVTHPDVAVGLENVRAAALIEDHRPAEIQLGVPL